jgi:hypothetical protein
MSWCPAAGLPPGLPPGKNALKKWHNPPLLKEKYKQIFGLLNKSPIASPPNMV